MPTPRTIEIITPDDEQLVAGNREKLKRQLLEQLERDAHVILNLQGTRYLDSTALGMLVSVHRAFQRADRRLLLCGLHEDVAMLFQMTKLDQIFTPCRDVGDARAQLEGLAA